MSNYAGFNQVELRKPRKSVFDLSHQVRLSTRMGRLTPVFITEGIPGDIFRGSCEILLRLAPLLAPIYDQIRLYVHFFFVANRLIWEDWEEFITAGRLGQDIDDQAPIPPYVALNNVVANTFADKSSVSDYLGVPIFKDIQDTPSSWNGLTMDVMPHLVFQKCYMDYYRDRNFVADDLIEFPFPSGITTDPEVFATRVRSYLHDYFTSALPFTQRGAEVLMPLAGTGTAEVAYLQQSIFKDDDTGAAPTMNYRLGGSANVPSVQYFDTATNTLQDSGRIENLDGPLDVTLDASSVSINDFRSAYALQVWLERNAIAGSRYTESIQAHFGVKPQDSRLQRAEYIGGGLIPVGIREVVSTAYSDSGEGTVPLANMAGHGITYGNTNQFHYYVPEHGFIIGIASIMNPPSYHQGLPRMFRRRSFLDYPWPTFATLGEQQVDKAELYASPDNLTEDTAGQLPLFGYQSRYAEWKYVCSRNAGDFHDSLLFWTLTRDFSSSPELGQVFNEFEDATQDRIFAVQGQDSFWLYVHNKVTVKRALPYFGRPNTIGFGA